MADELPNWEGDNVDDNDEMNNSAADYDAIETRLNNAYSQGDAKLAAELTEQYVKGAKEMIKKIAQAQGLDPGFVDKIDIDKPLDASSQGFTGTDADNINKLFNGDKFNKLTSEADKYIKKDIITNDMIRQANGGDISGALEKGFARIDDAASKISDAFKRDAWIKAITLLFKLLFLAGLITGGVFLAEAIKKYLCGIAKKDSSCTWTGDGKKFVRVTFAENAPQQCISNDYDGMCGGCDSGSPTDMANQCCQPTWDIDSKEHQNGQYIYQCKSGWGVLGDAFKSLGKFFNPSNLLQDLEKILIYVGIGIVVLAVGYIALKEIFAHVGEIGEHEENNQHIDIGVHAESDHDSRDSEQKNK